jgi:hypothetical protein
MSDDAPKSALEIAMARLRRKDEEAGVADRPLSETQKAEIADIRQTYAARLAQEEILYKSALMTTFDHEARTKVEENYRRDVDRLTHERDRKIAKVRGD